MKYIGYTLLFIAAIVACGMKVKTEKIIPSKNIITKSFTVEKFNKLDVSSAVEINYTQTNGTPKVEAKAPDNLIERLEVKSDNGELSIGLKKGVWIESKGLTGCKIVIDIEGPALNDIEMSGATTFSANSLKLNDFSLDMSGASTFKVESLVAQKADIELSGSSVIKLTNAQIAMSEFEVSGASDLNVKNYTGKTALIDLSGASSINMSGSVNSVELEVSGASNAKLGNLKAAVGRVQVSGASGAQVNVKKLEKIKSSGASKVKNMAK